MTIPVLLHLLLTPWICNSWYIWLLLSFQLLILHYKTIYNKKSLSKHFPKKKRTHTFYIPRLSDFFQTFSTSLIEKKRDSTFIFFLDNYTLQTFLTDFYSQILPAVVLLMKCITLSNLIWNKNRTLILLKSGKTDLDWKTLIAVLLTRLVHT